MASFPRINLRALHTATPFLPPLQSPILPSLLSTVTATVGFIRFPSLSTTKLPPLRLCHCRRPLLTHADWQSSSSSPIPPPPPPENIEWWSRFHPVVKLLIWFIFLVLNAM
ncbi:hypothetical protein Droror1_Dr00006933 [Drosera rotundifolia]